MREQILDQIETFKKIDQGDMLGTVYHLPEMVQEALGFELEGALNTASVQNIVIAGMGGSAVGADLLLSLYSNQLKIPVVVLRGYSLPGFVGPDSLVVLISYSGNTEEVLQVLKLAEKQKAAVAVISSGGKLFEAAQNKKYPCITVPGGMQPRAALGYLFFSLQKIFEAAGFISVPPKTKEEAVGVLLKLREEYAFSVPAIKNKAKQVAQKIFKKTPLVLGSEGLTSAAAYRWKTQFNENSKAMAFFGLFPETNHNEIVGLNNIKRGESNLALIILREEKENERIKKRIEITKSLLAAKLGGVIQIEAEGNTPLAKMFSLILLGDFVSVYLAILYGVDPAEIEVINRLKKELLR